MVHPFVSLKYHFVWGTWNRSPWITPAVEARLDEVIRGKCIEIGVIPLAFGAFDEHVHLLVGARATIAPYEIIGPIKGASARSINLLPEVSSCFRWQQGYGVFSVSRGDVPRVTAYVRGQRLHHARGWVDDDLERVHDDEPASGDLSASEPREDGD